MPPIVWRRDAGPMFQYIVRRYRACILLVPSRVRFADEREPLTAKCAKEGRKVRREQPAQCDSSLNDRAYVAGATYWASPLPKDQFSLGTSTRLMKTSSRRSLRVSCRPSAICL